MGFNTSSIWMKVAFICLLLAALLFVIGFATVSWMVSIQNYRSSSYRHYGLWNVKTCTGSCVTHSIRTAFLQDHGWEDWYRAVQAFQCIGLICLLMALLIAILYMFVDRMRKRSPLLATIAFCFGAVVCMVIGFIVMITQFEDYAYEVGWSQGLAMAAACLTFIAGVMCVIDLKK